MFIIPEGVRVRVLVANKLKSCSCTPGRQMKSLSFRCGGPAGVVSRLLILRQGR